MPTRTTLAKLSRPKLHNVLTRPRLFGLLETGRKRTVVWLVGPPGSGKTALVASYIDTVKVRCVWYHMDAGDHDPATFFHYLSQCLRTPSRQPPLPVITAEHLADLPAFARYYFRQFFARVGSPAVLVFDNYQDIPAQSALHGVLEQAFTDRSPQRSRSCSAWRSLRFCCSSARRSLQSTSVWPGSR